MTPGDFAQHIVLIRRQYRGSVTRWGSSDEHSSAVGGFAGDPHTWDLGVDMIYPLGPNREGSEDHPKTPHSCPVCSDEVVKVIHEPNHDHYQPHDFPAGPVTFYDGTVKDW